MKRLLRCCPLLLAAACATTPAPGSREAGLARQVESLESRNAALRAELATQQARLAPAFRAVTRAEESVRGKNLACAMVRRGAAPALPTATPARFELARRQYRMTAKFAAEKSVGADRIATGTCDVVSQ